MAEPVLSFDGVGKRFAATSGSATRYLATSLGGQGSLGPPVLDDIGLTLHPGEAVGVIGPNGAGKSTLLRVAAGISEPTTGIVSTAGSVAAILDLGRAFHPDLTAEENLPLAAAFAGLSQSELQRRREEIIEFSGLGQHMDVPIKDYSSGMVARLGFSLATHSDADVLLVDEVLAVGDLGFQLKCVERVRRLVGAGAALLFVSHDLDLVAHMCRTAICLDAGRIVDQGPVESVISGYASGDRPTRSPRWRQSARIKSFEVREPVIRSGGQFDMEVEVEVLDPCELRLQSEFCSPSTRSGAVNVDLVPDGVFDGAGRRLLRASLGPIDVTAATAELAVSLIEGAGKGAVVDRRGVLVEVVGEEMGGPKLILGTSWATASRTAGAPEDRVPGAAGSAPPVVWANGMSKRFRSRRWGAGADRDALVEVSFTAASGERIGLIGPNGSGKSTLLRCLAGVTESSAGSCGARGPVVAVLELGVGFQPELSSQENLRFSWLLHGGSPHGFETARHRIARFAGLETSMDTPVKHLSTGMAARLAMALAVELEPAVLLVDEALSVGDLEFRRRMGERLLEMCSSGTCLVLASHDLHLVEQLCTRVLRLDHGRLAGDTDPVTAVAHSGGAGWIAGSTAGGGPVVVSRLRVSPDCVEWNEPLSVDFDVDVLRPAPSVEIQFSIREALDGEARTRPLEPLEVSRKTMSMERIGECTDLMASVGSYTVRGLIEGVPGRNTANVVISAVDRSDGTLVSEQWVDLRFAESTGTHLGSRLQVTWSPGERATQ